MNTELPSLIRLGLAVGAGAGLALGIWRISTGDSAAAALLTALGAVVVAIVLAAVAAIGVRLQRKDLP